MLDSFNNTIKAILVGISAILAVSTPLTVYAEGTEGGENNENNENPVVNLQGQQQQEQPAPEVTAATDAISDATTAVNDAQTSTNEVAEQILDNGGIDADEEIAANVATAALETLETAAKKVDPDADLTATQEAVGEVNKQVTEALNQEKTANDNLAIVEEQAQEAADSVKAAEVVGDNAIDLVSTAETQMTQVIADVDNANSLETAQAAKKELADLISGTENTLQTMKATVDGYEIAYNAAIQKLNEAKTNYQKAIVAENTALGNAEGAVETALTEVQKAQTNVNDLKNALDDAKEKLETEAKFAETAGDSFGIFDTSNPGYDKKRATVLSVAVNYILPQTENLVLTEKKNNEKSLKNPGDYYCDYVKGFEMQDNNYVYVVYLDENNNKVYKYFNYDMVDKKLDPNDRYKGIGDSKEFFAFVKEEDEIKANDYLYTYFGSNEKYKNEKWYTDGIKKKTKYIDPETGKNVIEDMANAGDFDVFKYYDENGKRHFLVREEYNKLVAENKITKDENGVEKYGDFEVTMIVQNQNNLYHKANVYLISTTEKAEAYTAEGSESLQVIQNALTNFYGNDAEAISKKIEQILNDNKALNEYISDAHVDDMTNMASKYGSYVADVIVAQGKVNTAKDEVDDLKEAITALKNKHGGTKVITAAQAFGTNDVATYLGIKDLIADDQIALNNMTIDEIITVLNEMLDDAKDKVASAELRLQALKDQQPALSAKLDEIIDLYTPDTTPAATDDNPSDAPTGGAATYVAGDVTADTTSGQVAQGVATAGTVNDAAGDAIDNTQNGAVLGEKRAKVNNAKTTVADDSKEDKKASTPVKETKKSSVTIGDEDTAKAAMPTLPLVPTTPEEAEEGNWLWLIFIGFLTAIGLGAIFGFASKRKEEKEETK